MKRYILILLLVLFIFSLIFYENNRINEEKYIEVNKNIIAQKSFNVSSESTELDTSAKGTVFIQENKKVQIVTSIEIDPDDWGGVSVYIPKSWVVSNIISSYPENEEQSILVDFVTKWSTGSDKYEWDKYVEIGRGRNYKPTGGGSGTVVIDLLPDKKVTPDPETFNIMVAVGSNEKEGVKIVGTDYTEISIPLISD
ncbi:MAG: hypothetical protein RBT65_09215 [Methanolobus sp.]|jgi:hypothetical protein|nr:hypothetical protein [Methanolobus sp.]